MRDFLNVLGGCKQFVYAFCDWLQDFSTLSCVAGGFVGESTRTRAEISRENKRRSRENELRPIPLTEFRRILARAPPNKTTSYTGSPDTSFVDPLEVKPKLVGAMIRRVFSSFTVLTTGQSDYLFVFSFTSLS